MARAPALIETEALPEVDRLEGFPHPRETRTVFGHAPAERALVEAFASGRMHHAWLLAGRTGIGKATFAYRLARFLLASPNARTQPDASLDVAVDSIAVRQVLALSHPGLLVLRRPWMPTMKRFGTSIPIDEVRRLRSFLGHTAAEDTWRVVIVDTADDLNPNAANALLKSLEEPPKRTVFILLVSEPGRLLPTIRSRCRLLSLAPLGLEDLHRAASAAAAGRDEKLILSENMEALADGSVRRLLELSDGSGAKLHERILAILTALPKIDWGAAHALADDLGSPSADQRFEMFFTILLSVMAKAIRNAAAGEPAAWSIRPERAPFWAELWETIVRDKDELLELNLDRRAFILSTLSRLASAAQP
ncbi:MAG: DNA polymerase III subunit delta' [Hyphomicrobiaceae bacterium]